MAKPGAPKGNNNGGKGKPITDALIVALHRETANNEGKMTKRLVLMCDKVSIEAANGVQWAVQYVTDRIEGRATQALDVSGTVEHVEIDALAVLRQRIEGMASRINDPDADQSQDESIH